MFDDWICNQVGPLFKLVYKKMVPLFIFLRVLLQLQTLRLMELLLLIVRRKTVSLWMF